MVKMRFQQLFKNIFFFIFICLSLSSYAQKERIVDYNVDIIVNKDRSLNITEFIKVNSEGIYIRRGISRDMPTKRTLGDHGVQTVFYDIKSITKDGAPVNFHQEESNGEIIIYIGSSDVFIPSGLHQYTIKYRVKNQIAFFDDYEELYWNVIGTNNRFSIDNANVSISFPKGTELDEIYIYTGQFGEQKEQAGVSVEGNAVTLQTIEKLQAYEGITASISVPKGTFNAPSFFQKRTTLTLLIMSLASLLIYFFITWSRFGRDPIIGDVGPIYEPPDGLSPAECGYILNEYVTPKLAVSSIIDLINNGHIHIEKLSNLGIFQNQHQYILKNTSNSYITNAEQRDLHAALFRISNTQKIDGTYNSSLKSCLSHHKAALEKRHRGFINEGNNRSFIILPILWIIGTTALLAFSYYYEPYTEIAKLPILVLYPIFSIVLLGFYLWLIKKPTVEKVTLKAKIKGLKEYLSWTKKDYVDGYDMDIRDIEHFESLLPYAYALGVADNWQSSFSSLLKESQFANHPYYEIYMNPYFGTGFSRTMSTSSVPPPPKSSSGGGFSGGSGIGGGGFSGGGGGGGGVGGW